MTRGKSTFMSILDSLIPSTLVEDDPRDGFVEEGKVPNVMKDNETKQIKALLEKEKKRKKDAKEGKVPDVMKDNETKQIAKLTEEDEFEDEAPPKRKRPRRSERPNREGGRRGGRSERPAPEPAGEEAFDKFGSEPEVGEDEPIVDPSIEGETDGAFKEPEDVNGEDDDAPGKTYIGSNEDLYYYMVTDEGGSRVINDAEGNKVFPTDDSEGEPVEDGGEVDEGDDADFLIAAIKSLDMSEMDTGMFLKFILPKLEEEAAEDEMGDEEPIEEEEPIGKEEEEDNPFEAKISYRDKSYRAILEGDVLTLGGVVQPFTEAFLSSYKTAAGYDLQKLGEDVFAVMTSAEFKDVEAEAEPETVKKVKKSEA